MNTMHSLAGWAPVLLCARSGHHDPAPFDAPTEAMDRDWSVPWSWCSGLKVRCYHAPASYMGTLGLGFLPFVLEVEGNGVFLREC